MRILITGGAGMIGSHVAEYYANQGCDVVVFDNLMRSRLFGYDHQSVEYNWEYLASFPNIEHILGDIRNDADLLKAFGDGVDVVIHTAGQPGVPLSIRIPKEDFSINAFGTLNVLEHIRKICPEATFVYCSTNKVYGENVDKFALIEKKTRYEFEDLEGISEKIPIDHTGHTLYGASKFVGDLYTQEYARIYGMKTAVFRMSCIYGTRQFGFEDQGWVAWFIIAALLGKPITIFGNGKQVRDVLYVSDVVKAYDAFITSTDIESGVWNLGGGPENTTSLIEFIGALEKNMGTHIYKSYDDWRPSDQKVYVSDISKIKKELDWEPKINFEIGVKKLIDWVKENIELFEAKQ
ncbi:MAG: NAD-dependent epimerase/dehydratase family protein [Halanaerobiales bacterium]|nr:NAD-dependent epimerase/dehydratase family protein [Halanaerobiales bacterium]